MAWQQTADGALKQVLTLFNHRPEWRQAKSPHQATVVRAHVRQFTGDESELINAYGHSGVAIYVDAASIPVKPEKFDKFLIDGESFTAGGVHEMRGFNNSLLYYTIYARGGN